MAFGGGDREDRRSRLGLDILLRRAHPHQWVYDYVRLRIMSRLLLRNLLSTERVTDPQSQVVVSIATQPRRAKIVFLALESIGLGVLKPRRLILCIDNEDLSKNLPKSLRRLTERGLEVRLSECFGPHTKYYPYVASADGQDLALALADDDTLYPRHWLRMLVDEWRKHPCEVHCHTAQVVQMEEPGRIAPYATWPDATSREPSLLHFAACCDGVIYPPRVLRALRDEGSRFLECCPRADDVWLHRTSLRQQVSVRQVQEVAAHFPVIPGTDWGGLARRNVEGGENDVQIARTYDAADREQLWNARLGRPRCPELSAP